MGANSSKHRGNVTQTTKRSKETAERENTCLVGKSTETAHAPSDRLNSRVNANKFW